MSDGSKIEWTEATWNPVTGCTKVSPGCDHCYAETFAERWRGTPGHYFEHGFDVTYRPDKLDQPLHWKRPRRIFVNSMSDLFHDDVESDYITRVFAIMALTPQHTFQILTKRHGRLRSLLSDGHFYDAVSAHCTDLITNRHWSAARERELDSGWTTRNTPGGVTRGEWQPPCWPLPNVWLGVSVEDQKWADIRIPALIETPAVVRFLSCEPLLGEVSLDRYLWLTGPSTAGPFYDYAGRRRFGGGAGGQAISRVKARDLHWVIVGGESGPGAREMDSGWADRLVWECREAEVPVFVKQLGSVLGRELGAGPKGGDWDTWPEDLRIREFPVVAKAAA